MKEATLGIALDVVRAVPPTEDRNVVIQVGTFVGGAPRIPSAGMLEVIAEVVLLPVRGDLDFTVVRGQLFFEVVPDDEQVVMDVVSS
jgi:hypothetical protein